MISDYMVLFNQSYKSLKDAQSKIEKPNIKIFKFKDDVRILTASPEVVDTYLTIHNLSDYKNQKLTQEVNIAVTIPIEILLEEVEPECKVFSLLRVEL